MRLVRDCHAHLRTWNQSTIAPNSYNSVSGVCRWCPVSWAAHLKTHLINSNSSISNHKSAHVFSDSFALLWSAVSINAKQPPGVDAHVFQLLVDHKVTSQQGALWLPLSLCLSTSLPGFPYYIWLRVYPPICLAFSLPLYLSTYNNAINNICRASCFHESLASLGSGVIGLQSECCWEASVERSPSHLVNWKSSIPQTNQLPNLCFTLVPHVTPIQPMERYEHNRREKNSKLASGWHDMPPFKTGR